MNSTQLTVLKNTTKIESKRSDNTLISVGSVTSINSAKIKVTTIGIKGDETDIGVINRLQKTLGYTEFTEVNGDLTNKSIYTDNSKTTKLYNIDYSYTDGNMTQKVVTEVATNINVTYSYDYSTSAIPKITIT